MCVSINKNMREVFQFIYQRNNITKIKFLSERHNRHFLRIQSYTI